MEIKEIVVERVSGKELRNITARVKDADQYLVWVQRVDPNVTHQVGTFDHVDLKFKKR